MPRMDMKLTREEKREYKRSFDTSRIYMAEVMDVRNISRAGDLMVYLIGSGKNKKDSRNWIQASYASNLYGTTPYNANSDPNYELDPQSFGNWFPMPCVGNFVFVFFPMTSPENVSCYWFACPVNPNTNYMLPGIPGAYYNDEHKPLCERNDKCPNNSKDKEQNMAYINQNKTSGNIVNKDLENSNESSSTMENTLENNGSCKECDNNTKQKELNEEINKAEKIQAVYKPLNEALKRQGLEKDNTRGYSTAGAKRESPSMCYGIKTPLGNTFVMDDGWLEEDNKTVWKWNILDQEKLEDGNIEEVRKLVGKDGKSPWQREPNTGRDVRRDAGFRFRTRNGTQILIADEGTIFMINNDGSCWVEMTKNGYLEGYSKKGVAISSDGDINLHTKKNVYIEAEETIALKAKDINIETIGDINIAETPHINTEAIINGRELNFEKGKINNLEASSGKMIGEMGGTFYGLCGGSEIPGFPESNLKNIPDIKDFILKDNKPIKEEKNDIDGKGYSENDQEKTKNTINTKVPTHEPYCGHCKSIYKDNDEEKEELKESDYNSEDDVLQPKIDNDTKGCNKSTGCCNKSQPITSCKGCGGVTNQINRTPTPNEIEKKAISDKVPLINVSENFTLPQLCYSQTASSNGISNVPTQDAIENMKALAENILEPLKKHYGSININSCYRGKVLNSMIGGANNSQHQNGEAVDITISGVNNYDLAQWISNNLEYDQLILENCTSANNGWVHVSYTNKKNRSQKLTIANGVTRAGLYA